MKKKKIEKWEESKEEKNEKCQGFHLPWILAFSFREKIRVLRCVQNVNSIEMKFCSSFSLSQWFFVIFFSLHFLVEIIVLWKTKLNVNVAYNNKHKWNRHWMPMRFELIKQLIQLNLKWMQQQMAKNRRKKTTKRKMIVKSFSIYAFHQQNSKFELKYITHYSQIDCIQQKYLEKKYSWYALRLKRVIIQFRILNCELNLCALLLQSEFSFFCEWKFAITENESNSKTNIEKKRKNEWMNWR